MARSESSCTLRPEWWVYPKLFPTTEAEVTIFFLYFTMSNLSFQSRGEWRVSEVLDSEPWPTGLLRDDGRAATSTGGEGHTPHHAEGEAKTPPTGASPKRDAKRCVEAFVAKPRSGTADSTLCPTRSSRVAQVASKYTRSFSPLWAVRLPGDPGGEGRTPEGTCSL